MTDVVRWRDEHGLTALLTAYHLRTEEEKDVPVADAEALPQRYRAEIADPRSAFADDVVLLARSDDAAVGCLVVTAPVDGAAEVKRLWTAPAARGQGVATALITAALDHLARTGVTTVRLSVWKWRTGAIALYERLGFTVTGSWDDRPDLVCMHRVM
ncbi:GNAT family N-acetyltransferase [Saccharothrix sp. NRRL B-16314]|uniref:GNAT family N-acetyltransferase n=1 Tax=Saccharothrix sp. NRRL B-16314 TaxID=1463825 RepID=UPI000525B4E6|nr:GNAT family N-acetyltransferase [Saccharothrix sp. NRRL B-16314]